jgi:hypothetical protein
VRKAKEEDKAPREYLCKQQNYAGKRAARIALVMGKNGDGKAKREKEISHNIDTARYGYFVVAVPVEQEVVLSTQQLVPFQPSLLSSIWRMFLQGKRRKTSKSSATKGFPSSITVPGKPRRGSHESSPTTLLLQGKNFYLMLSHLRQFVIIVPRTIITRPQKQLPKCVKNIDEEQFY